MSLPSSQDVSIYLIQKSHLREAFIDAGGPCRTLKQDEDLRNGRLSSMIWELGSKCVRHQRTRSVNDE